MEKPYLIMNSLYALEKTFRVAMETIDVKVYIYILDIQGLEIMTDLLFEVAWYVVFLII